jgi:hypothetical protein
MYYMAFLQSVHDLLRPKAYLEIGVRHGNSLALAECRAVGIDPDYSITVPINGDIALFRTTSDEYFSRPRPLGATGGQPFDLSFIDGLHLFEFALRDFINAERHSGPGSAVIFDDVLPRSVDEAARQRHTVAWTGDVYPILEVLARYRPDLSVIPVGTRPTGLLLIVGLDPSNHVLTDKYDEIMEEFRRPDPQPVPPEVLERLAVLPPQRVLESSLWDVLRSAPPGSKPQDLRPRLSEALRTTLGRAFVPSPVAV